MDFVASYLGMPPVAVYEVHYGLAAGVYTNSRQTTAASLTIDQLDEGQTYYFAARACDQAKSQCSDYSNEVSATIAPETSGRRTENVPPKPQHSAGRESSTKVTLERCWRSCFGSSRTPISRWL